MKSQTRALLNNNITYFVLLIFLSLYMVLCFGTTKRSIFDLNDVNFSGTVVKKVLSSSKITFTLDSTEDLICNYYSDDDGEKRELWEKVSLGDTVTIEGELKVPSNNTIPNTFNYKKYLYDRGIFYTCTIKEIEDIKKTSNAFYMIKNFVIDKIMTFKTKDYLYTMIIGDKSLLEEETLDIYRKNGVTHLFAISGMHVGLFAVIVGNFLKRLRLSEKKVLVFTTVFIWFYAFLAGFGSSIIRAGLLFTFLTIDKIFNLNIEKIKILLLVGVFAILMDYKIIMDTGFIYSFVTTFGLIWSKKTLSNHKFLGTSLVASLFSLPITVNLFYKINLASIGFNIIFVPLVSSIIYPLCLLTFLVRWIEPVTIMMIHFLEFLNSCCGKIDFLEFVIPSLHPILLISYYSILLFCINKSLYKVSIILITMILLNKIKPILDTFNYVEFFDVGQGDSAIIRSSRSREVIMIDTGGKVGDSSSSYKVSDNVITYLNSLGIDKIDYLILSHGDADHLGDAQNVISKMNVKNVVLNRGPLNKKEIEFLESKIPTSYKYSGNLNLKFLNNKIWNDENSNSIVAHLDVDNIKFLFMGDASKEVEKYILEEYDVTADIIKLGHHGSKTSSDIDFLRSTKVKMGIISSGKNNRYNHPNIETIETLENLKLDYYNTQESGSIIFKIKDGRVTFFTYPP